MGNQYGKSISYKDRILYLNGFNIHGYRLISLSYKNKHLELYALKDSNSEWNNSQKINISFYLEGTDPIEIVLRHKGIEYAWNSPISVETVSREYQEEIERTIRDTR